MNITKPQALALIKYFQSQGVDDPSEFNSKALETFLTDLESFLTEEKSTNKKSTASKSSKIVDSAKITVSKLLQLPQIICSLANTKKSFSLEFDAYAGDNPRCSVLIDGSAYTYQPNLVELLDAKIKRVIRNTLTLVLCDENDARYVLNMLYQPLHESWCETLVIGVTYDIIGQENVNEA